MAPVYEFLLLLLFSQLILLTLAAGYRGECPPSFDCGYLGNISFPFTIIQRPDCGFLPIQNCDDGPNMPKTIQLENNGKQLTVVRVAQFPRSPTFQFRDFDLYSLLQSSSCDAFRNNYTLPHTFNHFVSLRVEVNTTLFRCNRTLHLTAPDHTFVKKYTKCPDYDLYYTPLASIEGHEAFLSSLTACTKVQLPIKDEPDAKDPFTFITADISTEVELTDECANCHYHQRGQCRLDTRERFCCVNAVTKLSLKAKLGIGLGIGIPGILIIGLLLLFLKRIFHVHLLFWRKNPTHRIMEEFLREHGPLPTTRYSYSEVKNMTNSFRNKLGQGGYGCVYKGKLNDGRVVAVKILNKSKGDGEEFINEVASISRTSHVNIVRLLGFCLDGSKRALLYEFMPNGSLEKFIYEEKIPLQVACQLDCKILFDIAIGVARGLEYLHRGCNTRILHFDIKPHNILLDEDFCPKISDFGLAKICPRKESAVSIFGARGTVGYIAPEVFSRNFGVVSHKSDVYSYGMMVLEMVGRRKNINVEVDCTSEIYFPHWIYNRLESNQELGLHNIKNEGDVEKMRKMTIVGLWCIQTDPSTRPAISRVVEMLEGRVELLQMPPKPFLSSPSSSPIHLSCETL